MEYEVLLNGDLKITVQCDFQDVLQTLRHVDPEFFVSDEAMCGAFEHMIADSGLSWTRPEYCGALTDAPILAYYGDDEIIPDGMDMACCDVAGYSDSNTWYRPVIKWWAYMQYETKTPLEDLTNQRYCIFKEGK